MRRDEKILFHFGMFILAFIAIYVVTLIKSICRGVTPVTHIVVGVTFTAYHIFYKIKKNKRYK